MADEKEKTKIPKLTNNNYAAWAFRIRSLLDSKDLLEVLTVSAPEVNTDQEVEDIATQNAQLAEWKTKDKKAKQIIVAHIEDHQIVFVKDLATSAEYWEALKLHHNHSTFGGKVRSLKQLFTKRLSNETTMREHIGKMLEIVSALREQGEEVADIVIVGAILASLPSNYDMLITAMEAWPNDRLTIPNIKQQLISEWDRRQAQATQRQKSESSWKMPEAYVPSRNSINSQHYRGKCRKLTFHVSSRKSTASDRKFILHKKAQHPEKAIAAINVANPVTFETLVRKIRKTCAITLFPNVYRRKIKIKMKLLPS